MKRIALLRTRCGCERYMEVDHAQRYIEMSLLPDFRDSALPLIEADAIQYEPLKKRTFGLDGQTRDGIYIYTEIYPK